jgi:hypothetical protein
MELTLMKAATMPPLMAFHSENALEEIKVAIDR